jgi:hypothetical protein
VACLCAINDTHEQNLVELRSKDSKTDLKVSNIFCCLVFLAYLCRKNYGKEMDYNRADARKPKE